MNFLKKNWRLLEHILVAILIIGVILTKCDSNRHVTENLALKIENQRLDSIKNQAGQTILVQEAVIVKDQKAIKDYTDSIFNLKKKQERQIKTIIAYYSQHTNTQIDSVPVPYVDTIATKKFSDSVTAQCQEVIRYLNDSTVTVPRTVETPKDSYNFYFKGTVTKSKFIIDSLSIVDSQYVRIVVHKGGLLRKDVYGKRHFWTKKKIEVQSFHTNTLIKVNSQTSVFFDPPKKKNVVGKLFLLGAGIYLGTLF